MWAELKTAVSPFPIFWLCLANPLQPPASLLTCRYETRRQSSPPAQPKANTSIIQTVKRCPTWTPSRTKIYQFTCTNSIGIWGGGAKNRRIREQAPSAILPGKEVRGQTGPHRSDSTPWRLRAKNSVLVSHKCNVLCLCSDTLRRLLLSVASVRLVAVCRDYFTGGRPDASVHGLQLCSSGPMQMFEIRIWPITNNYINKMTKGNKEIKHIQDN